MAIVTAFNDIDFRVPLMSRWDTLTYTVQTATRAVGDQRTPGFPLETTEFTGFGFTYNPAGELNAGAVTGFEEADGGLPFLRFELLTFTVAQAQAWTTDEIALATILDGNDFFNGSPLADFVRGYNGNDSFSMGAGNDTIDGGAGNDTIDGGAGIDTAFYDAAPGSLRIREAGPGILTVEAGALGTDNLIGIEIIETQDGAVTLQADLSGLFRASVGGENFLLLGTAYVGPVPDLQRQLFGSAANEVFGGTAGNDFIHLFAGDDAANGGAGDDVIDGGLGSNFLSGGPGEDTFFSDGRGGGVTWTTITDWEAGEQLSVWGWRPGTSGLTWVDSDGVGAFRGVTMHGDLNGDGAIDTSVTWSGRTRAELPLPLQFPDLLWFIG